MTNDEIYVNNLDGQDSKKAKWMGSRFLPGAASSNGLMPGAIFASGRAGVVNFPKKKSKRKACPHFRSSVLEVVCFDREEFDRDGGTLIKKIKREGIKLM